MEAVNALFQRSLTLPTGATTGTRIVIDGTKGTITGYYADNTIAWQLSEDPTSAIASYNDVSGPAFHRVVALMAGIIQIFGAGDDNLQSAVSKVTLSTNNQLKGDLDIQNIDASGNINGISAVGTANGRSAMEPTGESWQSPGLAANWALGDFGGSFGNFQYRVDSQDNFIGIGPVHMTLAAGLTAGTYNIVNPVLPVGYRPKMNPWRGPWAVHTSATNVIKEVSAVTFDTNGNFDITASVAIAQNDNFYIGIQAPLGNLG